MRMKLPLLFLTLALLLCGCAADSPEPTQWPEDKPMTVYFLDNCALLECGGEYLLAGETTEQAAAYLETLGVAELTAVERREPGYQLFLGGAKVTVLAPVDGREEAFLLRAEFGGTAFLFAGALDEEAVTAALDYWNSDPAIFQADVLMLGETPPDSRLLETAAPEYVVLSGQDLPEGLAAVQLRTDEMNGLTITSNGTELLFTGSLEASRPAAGAEK